VGGNRISMVVRRDQETADPVLHYPITPTTTV
jgi:hypothetical protein